VTGRRRQRRYSLVVPRTWRSGPGHSSHLSPDGGKTTLCKVENNALGLKPLGFGAEERTFASVEAAERFIHSAHTCRTLCNNCRTIAGRREGGT
jgi:hypothetical protein